MSNSNKKPIIMKFPDLSSPKPEYLEAVEKYRKNKGNDMDSPYPLFKIADMFHIKEIDVSDIVVDLSELDVMTEYEMYQNVQLMRSGFFEDNFSADVELAEQ